MKVGRNRIVVIDYVMRNSKGNVLENTEQTRPVSYLHGSSGIISLLQEQLKGCRTGDRIAVHLPKESGLTDDDFIFDVTIREVRKAHEEEINLGYPLPSISRYCGADCDCHNMVIINEYHKTTF
jgi:FKBP-type peptidyl-prolyl cis-trans isomerase SlyD